MRFSSAICTAVVIGLVLLLGTVQQVAGQSDWSSQNQNEMPPNLKMKTLGGMQFWTDIQFASGWKIQRHALTSHCRLIDQEQVRQCWGSPEQCQERLHQLVGQGKVRATSGRVVIVMHGLIRSTNSMAKLGDYLQQQGGYLPINWEYASTRDVVDRHATDLDHLIRNLGPEVTEIHFVAHSLGNIVVRRYLKKAENRPDPRIRRMVMIGPPNQGSRMAYLLQHSLLFKTVAGACGAELGGNWEVLEPTLATPDFEFGIIAGGQSEDQKFGNFILDGPDDFTVSVAETRLAGASDFLVRPLVHSTMMRHESTLKATLSFLDHGYFVSAEQRKPISADQIVDSQPGQNADSND